MSQYEIIQTEIKSLIRNAKNDRKTYVKLKRSLVTAYQANLTTIDANALDPLQLKDCETLFNLAGIFLQTELLTKKDLIERGWGAALIKKHLPIPDETKINPVYSTMAPMLLFSKTKVIILEAKPDINKAIVKTLLERPLRQAKSLAAAEVKRQELLSWVKELKIIVPKYKIEILLMLAVYHYNQQEFTEFASTTNDTEFLARIGTNYLRHECSGYEILLTQLAGKVNCNRAYINLKEKTNAAIECKYSNLESQIKLFKINAPATYEQIFKLLPQEVNPLACIDNCSSA